MTTCGAATIATVTPRPGRSEASQHVAMSGAAHCCARFAPSGHRSRPDARPTLSETVDRAATVLNKLAEMNDWNTTTRIERGSWPFRNRHQAIVRAKQLRASSCDRFASPDAFKDKISARHAACRRASARSIIENRASAWHPIHQVASPSPLVHDGDGSSWRRAVIVHGGMIVTPQLDGSQLHNGHSLSRAVRTDLSPTAQRAFQQCVAAHATTSYTVKAALKH